MPKILVCDDHFDTLEIMLIILSREGFEVSLRNTMVNLFTELDSINPDILLLDLRMPSIGGDEVIKKLKSNNKTAHLPVVLFSADMKGAVIAKHVGADAFVAKPFELEDLVNTLKDTLQKSLVAKQ